jgi:hypothetical protein
MEDFIRYQHVERFATDETQGIDEGMSSQMACNVAEQAIGEYAKQEAIDFADWITSSGYSISKDKGIWGHDMDFMCEQPKTTAELYEQFKAGGGK